MPEPSLSAPPPAIDQEPGRRWLPLLVIIAIALRIAARAWRGEESFLTEGYTFYLALADNFLRGDGFCYAPGESCAIRLPVYPLFIAALKSAGWLYPGVAVAQAVMGGATVWATWSIGRALFGSWVAMVSAAAVALNPYAVIHDTALQDTVLVNLLMLAAVALLMKAARTPGSTYWLAAGGVLALAVLTSARVALFAPGAVAWAWTVADPRDRARRALAVAVPVVLLVGIWLVRNAEIVGAPVLTTESGVSLFIGNSPLTFTHFPARSMDLVTGEFAALPPDVQHRIESLEGQEVASDRALRDLALAYLWDHPWQALSGAGRKLWVVASAELSPARGGLADWSYRAVYLPVHVLALVGLWRFIQRQREHGLLLLFVGAFAATTAVYWAHTSHVSLIHPVLFIYASASAKAMAR